MFRDLTREQFKAIFLEHATREQGWTWAAFEPERPGMRYRYEPPESPAHTRLMIATDFGAQEYRLFFMTEEAEERFFEFPDPPTELPPS